LSLLLLSTGTISRGQQSAAQTDRANKFTPTDVRLLSLSSPTKDEDPSVISAQDGTIFVAWFSDRGGNADIYVTATHNGTDWNPPVRVTTSHDGDFYPNLFQDSRGTFHLVWFRWTQLFRGHIWHNSSPDGLTWNQETEEPVTVGKNVDDWVPTITQASDGTLLVFFVSARRNAANSTSEIYVTMKHPNDVGWNKPLPPAGINSATQHDQLPFATRTGDKITLVWVRHDTTQVLPWLNPKSDLFFSTSTDGQNWTVPLQITNDAGNVVHLFPAIYPKLDDEWSLIWLSNKPGVPVLFELPLTNVGAYPLGVITNNQLRAGYSHRIAPTSTTRIYIGVWTEGPEGAQDIYYRFFKRSR
jgi:hypothetical protein